MFLQKLPVEATGHPSSSHAEGTNTANGLIIIVVYLPEEPLANVYPPARIWAACLKTALSGFQCAACDLSYQEGLRRVERHARIKFDIAIGQVIYQHTVVTA